MSEFDNLEHFPIGIFTLNKLAMGFPIPKSSISPDNRSQSQSKFRFGAPINSGWKDPSPRLICITTSLNSIIMSAPRSSMLNLHANRGFKSTRASEPSRIRIKSESNPTLSEILLSSFPPRRRHQVRNG